MGTTVIGQLLTRDKCVLFYWIHYPLWDIVMGVYYLKGICNKNFRYYGNVWCQLSGYINIQ